MSVRNIRRKAMEELGRIKKDGEAGEDEVSRAEKDLDKSTQSREVTVAVGGERFGARRGEAREHGQAERAAHHERGVDDARGEPRLAPARRRSWPPAAPG